MIKSTKLNSEIKAGDTVQYWSGFATVTSVTDLRLHPTVKKMCVSFNFADKPGMTAFLEDFTTVAIPIS